MKAQAHWMKERTRVQKSSLTKEEKSQCCEMLERQDYDKKPLKPKDKKRLTELLAKVTQ